MTAIVNVVRHLDANLGDHLSSPARYIPWLTGSRTLDPHEGDFSSLTDPTRTPDVVVVGGGGQIANLVPEYDANLEQVSKSPAVSIAWGVGHNRHGAASISYPSYLDHFDLVGIRDYGSPYEWVPCASCLHTELDEPRSIDTDVVLYEHWQIPSGVTGLPTMRNDATHVGQIFHFLGSAAVVVTNTYHGCYWATLLGRRVVLVDPFSTKFLGFRHPPTVSTHTEWRSAVDGARSYPGALEECREANRRFAGLVRDRCVQAGVRGAEDWDVEAGPL